MARGVFELDVIRDNVGQVISVSGAVVTVYKHSDGGLAAIFDSVVGGAALSNPFNVAGTTVKFYAEQNERYRIDIVSGAFSRTLLHRAVTADLEETIQEAIAAAPVQSVAGKTGDVALDPADVGLDQVDNTADTDKPVSTAQATEIALKAAGRVAKYGFPVDASGAYLCTLTYNETTRTVTLTPTGASFGIFVGGVPYSFVGAQSIAHSAVGANQFVYFNENGTLVTGTTPWDLTKHAPVCYIFQDVTNSRRIAFEERHHAGRDVWWHKNQHALEGTKVLSGFAASGYTEDAGANDAQTTYAIALGVLADEDIEITTEALSDGGPYCILERAGAGGAWQLTRTNTLPFLSVALAIQYNQDVAGTWQRTAVPEDQFVNYWVFGLTALPAASVTPAPSAVQQIVIIPGQRVFATEVLAHAETPADIAWGTMPFQEIAPLYQVTMHKKATGVGNYNNTGRCAIARFARLRGTFVSLLVSGTTDHGSLSGLDDDDHLIYGLQNPPEGAVTYTTPGTTTVALDGRTEVFYATAAVGPTTWDFTNPVVAGKISSFILELTNGGAFAQTWPASVRWEGGEAPALTAAGVDILIFYTRDGGTTWRGFVAALDSKAP